MFFLHYVSYYALCVIMDEVFFSFLLFNKEININFCQIFCHQFPNFNFYCTESSLFSWFASWAAGKRWDCQKVSRERTQSAASASESSGQTKIQWSIRNWAKADGASNWDRKELFWRRTWKPGKIGDKSVNRFDKKQLQRNTEELGDMVGQNHRRCWRFTCKRWGFKIKGIQCFKISLWSIERSTLFFLEP